MTTDDVTHPLKLFGEKWVGSPAAEHCEQVHAPVGERCASCDTDIVAGQSGVFMWHIEDTPEYRPLHRICFLYPILGPMIRGELG